MNKKKSKRPITVLIVTEYFVPTIGGVEIHVYKVAEYLIKFGFKVVIFTRNFGDRRRGVRYMENGIKVYHQWNNGLIPPSTIPTFIDLFPYYRNILIREKVDVVHTHMSASRLKLEIETYSIILGYRVVFTDHSLFSFSDLGPIFLNEDIKHYSPFLDHLVAVSNRHKENIVLRSEVDPRKISVIPNGLESKDFGCNAEQLPLDKIVIVYICRLCERKGIDLVVQVIPIVCKRHKNVEFIIGGGGDRIAMVRAMVDKFYLHDRVQILGYVPTHEVNNVLRRGHIFLVTSQTESFCIAALGAHLFLNDISEAASSGLIVVSTSVGGIPEILPHDMVLLSDYDPLAFSYRIDEAIGMLSTVDTRKYHERVKNMYSWEKTALKLTGVYYKALLTPRMSLREKIYKLLRVKNGYGISLILIFAVALFQWFIYEYIFPRYLEHITLLYRREFEEPPNWSQAQCRDAKAEKAQF
ncbi:glycosyl transferase [Theileria orientalis strain Shintoku]|uniref:Glycosyl transferase n=1 Tax=Theileria orientalis strain Shintoku TaxID=869250 RepID=J4C923_THEOR|nr:glycosyl transferase [Theileria orientalis strain Shintoku]PVC53676.1 glycosyl transferase [Theileria orientalis]BAM41788.1 glycosyl transferase [Theileria orientalis strain Shintoku]|eukprot:XP_009692089.1 glycosyl transferase [Theileria orientalis strain Shintoku]